MSNKCIISIDMGGTKILAAAINSKDGIIALIKRPTKPTSSKSDYIKKLADIVSELIVKNDLSRKNIKAVTIGFPGSLNPFTGKLAEAPNLGVSNFALKSLLQKKIPFPVLIENDVNLAALGIKKFGVAKTAKNALVVFFGTGIGGALIFDGKLYRGSDYSAGEIGHIKIKSHNELCGCGNRGCFESIASRAAIVKKIQYDMKCGKKTAISKLIKPTEKIKSGTLARAVKLKDKVVIKRLEEACKVSGTVLANINTLLNLDMIVLGGGVIEAMDKFMVPRIMASFNKSVLNSSAKGLTIKASKLGDMSALYGGIVLAEEFLGTKV